MHTRLKLLYCTLPFLFLTTRVNAEGNSTIHSYTQFRAMMTDGTSQFAQNLKMLIRVGKNLGLLLLGFAFVLQMIALAIQSGKLGGANVLGPESNAKSKQDAYEGIMHAVIGFAVIGAASTIFGWIFDFFL